MTQRTIIYGSLAILIGIAGTYFYINEQSPYGERALYNHKFLAQVPTDCEENCDYIEYFRDQKESCILKKVKTTLNTSSTKVEYIQHQDLTTRKEEKGERYYLFDSKHIQIFDELCNIANLTQN